MAFFVVVGFQLTQPVVQLLACAVRETFWK